MAKGNFAACHAVTSGWEGGWSNHDADPGGATMYGITVGTLSKWRGRKVPKAEVKALTRSEAEQIYKAWYWDKVKADELPAGVDLVIYDYAVNSGPSRAAKALQRAVGVKQDGAIGPVTLAAVRKVDPVEIVETVCAQRLAFLRRLGTWGDFGKGWSNRVNDVLFKGVKMASRGSKIPTPSPKPNPDTSKSGQGILAAIIAAIASILKSIFGGRNA